MKITGFRPLIISAKANDAIELFEVLGFEKRHTKTGIEGKMKEDVTTVAMKDANGFRVNVAQADKIPSDLTVIAMNVDDFDEAYEFLKARGFVNEQGDGVTDTGSSKATLMMSPSGYGIVLSQHLKNEIIKE